MQPSPALTSSAAAAVPSAQVPGPQESLLFGSIPAYRRDALELFGRVAREFGSVAKVRVVQPGYVVTHPDGVKHVLQDNHVNYRKNFIYDRLRPMLGNGLLTSNGEFWKRQRRLAQPAFHRQRIAGFADLMVRRTQELLARWEQRPGRGQAFDVHQEMMKLTLVIVAESLFGIDVEKEAEGVGEALTTALEVSNDRLLALFVVPEALPTRQNRRFAAAMRVLKGLVQRILQERRASGVAGDDLLGMLLSARDPETGEGMTDEQLKDEVMTMALAGHETTANALTWAFYLLSRHPEVERRLYSEVSAALGDRLPTLEDLPRLRFATAVAEETMRLYPPIWSVARRTYQADVICGFEIPAESNVVLVPYVTHRHPDFWDNPEGFEPDRFMPENAGRLHRGAYFPFAAGPRQCIGSGFAMMELGLLLTMIVQRFRLSLAPQPAVVPYASVTLRPKDGLKVVAHRRHGR